MKKKIKEFFWRIRNLYSYNITKATTSYEYSNCKLILDGKEYDVDNVTITTDHNLFSYKDNISSTINTEIICNLEKVNDEEN